MTITFKIKETIAELLAGCKAYEHYDFLDKGDHYQIHDQDFDSYAAWIELEDGSVKILTAMSSFTYHIIDLPEGGAQVVYEGAYRGLLEQFLLPHMTAEFTAIDTVRTSTGEFMTLACYQAIKGGHYKIRYEGIVYDADRFGDLPYTELQDRRLLYSSKRHSEDEVEVLFMDGSLGYVEGQCGPKRRKKTES